MYVNQAADKAGLKAEKPVAKELVVSPEVTDKSFRQPPPKSADRSYQTGTAMSGTGPDTATLEDT